MIKFSIPNKLEDLTSVSDESSYIVSQQYSVREVNEYLNDLNSRIRLKGAAFILDDFDFIYSAIKNFKLLESQCKNTCFKTLLTALSQLEDELNREFQKPRANCFTDPCEKLSKCNTLKMLIFSVVSLVEIIEGSVLANKLAQTDVRASAKKKNPNEQTISGYDREREKCVNIIYKLIVMPLQLLFQPAFVEDDLIRCVTSCCWRLIENQNLHRNKPLMDNIFHIIGYTIEKYSGSLGFCLKILQLLQHRENLVSILGQLVGSIVQNHNQSLLISEIIREVQRVDTRDLSRDTSGPRAISLFLCEIGEKCPNEMMNSIANLLPFLDQDSYIMRNATLSIIGTIISKNLSQDKMSNREKNLRDELLNKLELHLLDVSSYTRGRALQVWCRLCTERKIPLVRLDTLMEAVVGRLHDKTTYVRKYAVQFLTCFLRSDIFAVQLDLNALSSAYERAKSKYEELDRLREQLESKGEKIEENNYLEAWDGIEIDFFQFLAMENIDNIIENGVASDKDNEENGEIDLDDFDSLSEMLKVEIDGQNFNRAVQLYALMKEKFPDNEAFEDDEDETIQKKNSGKCEKSRRNKKNRKRRRASENEDTCMSIDEDADNEDKENETINETNGKGEGDNENGEDENEDEGIGEEHGLVHLRASKIVKFCKTVYIQVSKKKTIELGEETMRGEINRAVSNREKDSNASESHAEESLEKVVDLLEKQKNVLIYLRDIIIVTKYLKSAVPLVCTLLYSKTIQDVQEAINFLVTAYEFGIKEEAQVGLRKMIILIFSTDGTKKEVIEAYKRILFEAPENAEQTGLEKAKSIVSKLVELVKGSDLDEIISLQELLREMSSTNSFDKHVIQLLWDKFSLRSGQTTEEESRICIQLISMLASSNPQLIRKNLDLLVSVGLGERALTDLQLARYTCSALSKAMTNQGRIITAELPYRLLKSHSVFVNIVRVVVETFPGDENDGWLPMCEEAFKVIFNLAEHPDTISEEILYGMIRHLMKYKQSQSKNNSTAEDDREDDNEVFLPSQSTNSSTSNDLLMVPPKILARFIHSIGSVAMNLLIHLEVNVFTELKTRNAIKEERDNRKSLSQTVISMSRRKSSGRRSTGGGLNEDDDELGLTGVVSAEDAEAEFIASLCNSEIVDPHDKNENLLAKLSRIVVKVASDPKNYPHEQLKSAASLTLAKMMAISENFCKNNIRLLITILKKAEDPAIRSNTIIAVGDLCVRFPNLLEPWTSHLYQSLQDDCVLVRTNALKVISRLILSDMIKVQDQISEMAKLMVDPEEHVSCYAKLFFTQLSKKLNAVYNVLPDIISNLSDSKVGIEENDFRTIMRFLFELIDKERHTIGLLEKMCQRFKNTLNERQWVDLSFCLSLLKYSDKSITKLFENFSCFADKVSVAAVYELFMSIVTNAKKTTGLKNETKQMLDEFETKLKQAKNKGVDEDEIAKEDGEEGDEEEDDEDEEENESEKTMISAKDQST